MPPIPPRSGTTSAAPLAPTPTTTPPPAPQCDVAGVVAGGAEAPALDRPQIRAVPTTTWRTATTQWPMTPMSRTATGSTPTTPEPAQRQRGAVVAAADEAVR